MVNLKIQIFSIMIVLLAIGYWLLAHPTSAQTAPELLITWQAENYAPPGYLGKVLPIRGTRLTAAVEVIDNGRLADLAGREIRWFLNRELLKSGVGLKNITFTVPGFAGDDQILRAEVRNYRGRNIEKQIAIPLAAPEIIIDASYPDKKIEAGFGIFKALPYFFNIGRLSDLSFEWRVNGVLAEEGAENPDILELDASTGRTGDLINLSVAVSSLLKQLEFAGQTINLSIR